MGLFQSAAGCVSLMQTTLPAYNRANRATNIFGNCSIALAGCMTASHSGASASSNAGRTVRTTERNRSGAFGPNIGVFRLLCEIDAAYCLLLAPARGIPTV